MIDNNKIKEAIEDYVRHSSVEDEYPGTEGDAFKAGAKWAINEFLKDLWHPVSEEPEYDKKILVQYTNYHLETDYEVDMHTPFTEWKQHAVYYKFMKWCYIEDVLQKGVQK